VSSMAACCARVCMQSTCCSFSVLERFLLHTAWNVG
jgi:hypothetical protein